MKSTIPLVIGCFVGWFAFGELYVPHEDYRWVFEFLRDQAQILAAMAFILGGINVIQVNYPKIRRREADWQYKVVLLVGAVAMGTAGLRWHALGGEADSGSMAVSGTAAVGTGYATLAFDSADRDALVIIDGAPPVRAWHSGNPSDITKPPGDQALSVQLRPGEHVITVRKPVEGYAKHEVSILVADNEPTSAKYEILKRWVELLPAAAAVLPINVAPGQVVTVSTDLVMYWGAGSPHGRVFTWMYDHIFFPCNATMFALLAFFIASAAFRAFRARNTESALLLGAAILVMIGLVPIGRAMSPIFPEIEEWIMDTLNTTGRRAIMMGAALGAIATGLRVILGIERSHLGSD